LNRNVFICVADYEQESRIGKPYHHGRPPSSPVFTWSEFDSRRYQIFCEVVGLERGPLSLVSTTEELLDRKVAAPV
jgi:hypothetical protein